MAGSKGEALLRAIRAGDENPRFRYWWDDSGPFLRSGGEKPDMPDHYVCLVNVQGRFFHLWIDQQDAMSGGCTEWGADLCSDSTRARVEKDPELMAKIPKY